MQQSARGHRGNTTIESERMTFSLSILIWTRTLLVRDVPGVEPSRGDGLFLRRPAISNTDKGMDKFRIRIREFVMGTDAWNPLSMLGLRLQILGALCEISDTC